MGIWWCLGDRGDESSIPKSRMGRKKAEKVAGLPKQADPWAGVSIVGELSSRVGLKRPGMWTEAGLAEPGLAPCGRG